jgi:hypothetical protein
MVLRHLPASWLFPAAWAGAACPPAAFASEAGTAWRHDVLAFLAELYLPVREQDDVRVCERLQAGLRAVPKEMP